jgi:hypothetical protein
MRDEGVCQHPPGSLERQLASSQTGCNRGNLAFHGCPGMCSQGRDGAYTRKKGLDREQNLALLLKHIEKNKATGSPRADLLQVLPNLSESTVRSLLQTLKRRKLSHPLGERGKGLWFPGPAKR